MPTKSKSTTRIEANANRRDRIPPVHPGETLEEYIVSNGLTSYRVATDIGVSSSRVNEIVLRTRAITADMALRLAKYFDVSPEFWMNLQARFDLDVARDEIEDDVARIKKFDRATVAKVLRPRTAAKVKRIVKRAVAKKA